MKLVVCEHILDVQTSKQCGKKLAVCRGLPGGGGRGPSHGTTGTMVNQALPQLKPKLTSPKKQQTKYVSITLHRLKSITFLISSDITSQQYSETAIVSK